MKVKAIVLALLSAGFATVFLLAYWPSHKRGESALTNGTRSAASADAETEAVSRAIAKSLGVDRDDYLPRGVKRIEDVSIVTVPQKQITIEWALRDGSFNWAGGFSGSPIRPAIGNDVQAILNGLFWSGLTYDTVRLKGTFPVADLDSLRESVIVDALYTKAGVQAVLRLGVPRPRVVIDWEQLKQERKTKTKEPHVLGLADHLWVAPDSCVQLAVR